MVCRTVEDVQGVLTLFCRGAAQVCHVLRVEEHVRHASVEVQVQCVNVVIGVVLGELLVVVRVVPILLVML